MESFENIRAKISEYTENLREIEIRIQNASGRKLNELISLKSQIERAIQANQKLLENTEAKVNQFFTSVKLKATDLNRKCNVYIEDSKEWVPGEVSNIISEHQAYVKVLRSKETQLFPSTYIQLLIPLGISDMYEGQSLEVLTEDGIWSDCKVVSFDDSSLLVNLKGQRLHCKYDSVRFSTGNSQKPLIEKDTFEIPEGLKILPNDNRDERVKKKKKIRALKKAWKEKQNEKESKEYVKNWKNFQMKMGRKNTVPQVIPEKNKTNPTNHNSN